MALSAKVGSFTLPAAAGTQAITGVGFTPKAIIFWTTGSDKAANTWSSGVFAMLGFTGGSTNSYAVCGSSQHGVSPSNTARRTAAKALTFVDVSGATTYQEADLQSFDADGFTLNYTTYVAGVAGTNINYLALGGSDITNVKAITYQGNTGTALQAVTGVGFKPDLVLQAHNASGTTAPPNNSTHSRLCFGAMNRHGQQWSNGIVSLDAVNPSDTARYQQSDACIAIPSNDGATISAQAHFVSMDTDGFSYLWSTILGNSYLIALCIKGISSKIGVFKKTAVATGQQKIGHVGFRPKAVMVTDVQDYSEANNPTTYAYWHLGATDGVNHRLSELADRDGVATTVAQCLHRTDVCAGTQQSPGVTDGAAVPAFLADGFSLQWTPNAAYSTEHCYLALGDV